MKSTGIHKTIIGFVLMGVSVSLAAQEDTGDTVGTVSFATVATSAWRVTEVEGDGVSTQGGTGGLVLEIGGRYVFGLSEVDSEMFPMELRGGSGTVIATQRDEEASEEFEDADISVSEDEIRFTLTEELASQISFYRAATYPSMIGIIRTYSAEAAQAAQESGEESDQDGE